MSEDGTSLFESAAPLLKITSIAGSCISRAGTSLDAAFLTGDIMSIFVCSGFGELTQWFLFLTRLAPLRNIQAFLGAFRCGRYLRRV